MPLVGSHIVPWAGLSMCHYKAPRGPHLAIQLNDSSSCFFFLRNLAFLFLYISEKEKKKRKEKKEKRKNQRKEKEKKINKRKENPPYPPEGVLPPRGCKSCQMDILQADTSWGLTSI